MIEPGSPDDVAVVSHDEWERALGGRPLTGLTIWVGEREYRVIGVLPPGLTLSAGPPDQNVWIPLPLAGSRGLAALRRALGLAGPVAVVVKLKPRWTWDGTRQQLDVLANRLTMEYGSGPVPYAFSLKSIVPDRLGLKRIHFAMAGAAFLILLIACVNLANLMLVRGTVKRRELALRMAMGAGRAALVRQLFAESAVLAALGAGVGLVLSLWAVSLLYHRMPPSVAMLGVVRPHASWRVLVAGLALAAAALVGFGLWPAVRTSNVNVSEPLKESSGTSTARRRWRFSPLLIAEVALSLVLLMSAALLVKAVKRQSTIDIGYDPTGLLLAQVWLGRPAPDSLAQLSANLLARVHAIPGVKSAAAVLNRGAGSTVMSESYDGTNGLLNRASTWRVSSGFLATLGMRVRRGRDFLPGDEDDQAVIVDQDAALLLWPDGRALGRLVKLGGPGSNTLWHRVVGVVPSTGRLGGDPFLPSQGTIYVAFRPDRQWGWGVVIRTAHLSPDGGVALREGIRNLLPPGGRLYYIVPWLARYEDEMRARYFLVETFGSFSAFALLLSAIGVYGVISYSAEQRMREFAIRIAVGAPTGQIMKLVAHDAAVMLLAGTGMGAFLAMWSSKLLGDWLYNVHHTDAASLVIAEGVLLLAGLLATLQPALRAMRANPVEILRAI